MYTYIYKGTCGSRVWFNNSFCSNALPSNFLFNSKFYLFIFFYLIHNISLLFLFTNFSGRFDDTAWLFGLDKMCMGKIKLMMGKKNVKILILKFLYYSMNCLFFFFFFFSFFIRFFLCEYQWKIY